MNFDKNYKYIKKYIKKYSKVHTDFIYNEIGSAIKFVKHWEEQKFIIDNEDDYYLLKKFNKHMKKNQGCVDEMFGKLNIFNILGKYIDDYDKDIQYEKYYYVDKIEKINMYKHSIRQKIFSLYNKDVSIIDLIFDEQFLIVYGVKILSFLLLVVSLNISEIVFAGIYSKNVFEKGILKLKFKKLIGI